VQSAEKTNKQTNKQTNPLRKMPESSDQRVTRSNSNASRVVPRGTVVIKLLDDLRKTIPADQELFFTRNFRTPHSRRPLPSPRVQSAEGALSNGLSAKVDSP
jgi:hypothetical protein